VKKKLVPWTPSLCLCGRLCASNKIQGTQRQGMQAENKIKEAEKMKADAENILKTKKSSAQACFLG
jgi:hypothetical protein